MLQVDPYSVVAPRAKAVVVREHIRRKGVGALLANRSAETGDLLDNDNRQRTNQLIEDARARAKATEERELMEEWAQKDREARARAEQKLAARAAAAAAGAQRAAAQQ